MMRRLVVALVAGALIGLPATPAGAQIPGLSPDACMLGTTQAAEAALSQSLSYSNLSGYGPYGWGPLAQPFGADPIGTGTFFFAPPGAVPTYGPLGPGLTANAIAAFGIPAGGFGFQVPAIANFANRSALGDLASLQQSELGTLYSRLSTGALFQLAGVGWGLGYAAETAATRTILRGLCRSQQLRGALTTAAEAAARAGER
jgi:hypothetical protein